MNDCWDPILTLEIVVVAQDTFRGLLSLASTVGGFELILTLHIVSLLALSCQDNDDSLVHSWVYWFTRLQVQKQSPSK